MAYDNEFVWRWSQDWENDGNTGDTNILRQVQASRRIIALCPLFLYCSWQFCCGCTCPLGVTVPLLLYQRGRGYKEGNHVGYNMIPIRTISICLVYICFYRYSYLRLKGHVMAFWKMGRALGVPPKSMRLGTHGTNPHHQPPSVWQMSKCWWSWSSLSVMKLSSTQFRNQVSWHEITELIK
jgi:hypothetical protein